MSKVSLGIAEATAMEEKEEATRRERSSIFFVLGITVNFSTDREFSGRPTLELITLHVSLDIVNPRDDT